MLTARLARLNLAAEFWVLPPPSRVSKGEL
jgi:hypothetical protein